MHYYIGRLRGGGAALPTRPGHPREGVRPGRQPEVATTLNNLAVLYRQKGDYAKAEPLLLRGLAITEKRVGPDHTSVTPTLNNLASIYRSQGEFTKAEGLYRRALAIREKALGPTHPDVGLDVEQSGPALRRTPTRQRDRGRSVLRAIARHTGEARWAPIITGSPRRSAALGSARRSPARSRQPPSNYHQRALWHSGEGARSGSSRRGAVARASVGGRPSAGRPSPIGEPAPAGPRSPRAPPRSQSSARVGAPEARLPEVVRAGRRPRGVAACADARPIPRRFSWPSRRSSGARAAPSTRPSTTSPLCASAPARRIESCSIGSPAPRSQLAALTLRGPGGGDAAAYRSQLRQLEDAVDRLEAEVGRPQRRVPRPVSPRHGAGDPRADSRARGARRVRVVSPHARRRDRRLCRRGTPRTSRHHGAEPQWVDLGEAAAIDRAVAAWRRALRDPQRSDARQLGRALDARIMQPVRTRLGPLRHAAHFSGWGAQPRAVRGAGRRGGQLSRRAFHDHLPDQRPRPVAAAGPARDVGVSR